MRKSLVLGMILAAYIGVTQAVAAKELYRGDRKVKKFVKKAPLMVNLVKKTSRSTKGDLNKRLNELKLLFVKKKSWTLKQIKNEFTGVSQRTLRRYLDKLESSGYISQKGSTKDTVYILK